jgi:hypothetical protein
MRALLTLIKRQLADNAVYFLAAVIFSIVLIIAIISITFSEDITYLSFYTVILITIVPILFGIGSYILAVSQVYFDKMSGVTPLLSVLPVTTGRIFFIRLIIGTLIILTLLSPLAIIGTILWKLLGPPDWLFHNWLGDTFIGLSLASLACYCLGLSAAQRAETFASALRALPLVPILMLLIVIKGFGWPLLVVLLPILAVLLLCCFKPNSNRCMTIIATGFITLASLAIPLYIGRNVCNGLLVTKMKAKADVSPSGLLAPEIDNDPNVTRHFTASSSVDIEYWRRCIVRHLLGKHFSDLYWHFDISLYCLENTGIIQYFKSLERGKRYTYTERDILPSFLIHLDEIRGQVVYHHKYIYRDTDEYTWKWDDAKTFYFGPNGISDAPNNKQGRFESPIIYKYSESADSRFETPKFVVYDAKSHCFFALNLENKTIRKGREIQESSFHPINISSLANSVSLGVDFSLPSTKSYQDQLPIIRASSGYLTIVEESGQINLLDPNTLELHGPAGYLPRPRILFGRASSKPIDLLDYDVELVSIAPYKEHPNYGNFYAYRKAETKGEYLGLIAGSLSRQGMWTSVAVFDKDGKKIKSADSNSTFFNVPGGPALTITKYIFESLHPPVLTLASFFTAYSFDARSSRRAPFLMPNSFVAMARDYEGNVLYKSLLVVLLMLPGIIFAALLGWRVTRDAATIGLSNNVRRFWLAGTLVFGLPVYVTYRLTRPKVTLVTCANCGKPRRPDMEICHRCGSKWDVPELTPPEWRVLDI